MYYKHTAEKEINKIRRMAYAFERNGVYSIIEHVGNTIYIDEFLDSVYQLYTRFLVKLKEIKQHDNKLVLQLYYNEFKSDIHYLTLKSKIIEHNIDTGVEEIYDQEI